MWAFAAGHPDSTAYHFPPFKHSLFLLEKFSSPDLDTQEQDQPWGVIWHPSGIQCGSLSGNVLNWSMQTSEDGGCLCGSSLVKLWLIISTFQGQNIFIVQHETYKWSLSSWIIQILLYIKSHYIFKIVPHLCK